MLAEVLRSRQQDGAPTLKCSALVARRLLKIN
jgi:hypothetical protein